MAKKFKTRNGQDTDIFHGYPYFKATAKMRTDAAFNKEFLESLTKDDRLLLRGYAQRLAEEKDIFKYKNPNYVPKGQTVKNDYSDIRNHFYGKNKK